MKMKKFWSRIRGTHPLHPPLDPPLLYFLLYLYRSYSINLNNFFHFLISDTRHDELVQNKLQDLREAFNGKRITNLEKTKYHQEKIRVDKSTLDQVYCFTSLARESIQHPNHVRIELAEQGGNQITVEKKTDVPVAISKNSISQALDCQFILIVLKPTSIKKNSRRNSLFR